MTLLLHYIESFDENNLIGASLARATIPIQVLCLEEYVEGKLY